MELEYLLFHTSPKKKNGGIRQYLLWQKYFVVSFILCLWLRFSRSCLGSGIHVNAWKSILLESRMGVSTSRFCNILENLDKYTVEMLVYGSVKVCQTLPVCMLKLFFTVKAHVDLLFYNRPICWPFMAGVGGSNPPRHPARHKHFQPLIAQNINVPSAGYSVRV